MSPRLSTGAGGSFGEGHLEFAHDSAAAADEAGRVFKEMPNLWDVFGARLTLLDVPGKYAVLAPRLTPQTLLQASAPGLLYGNGIVLKNAVGRVKLSRRALKQI